MPIPLSPNDKFKLVLKSDEAKAEPKPTFVFHHLSGREARKMGGMMDEMDQSKTAVEAINRTFEILRVALVGWENLADATGVEIPYAAEKIEDVLTMREAMELGQRAFEYSPDPDGDDLKNFESPSIAPTSESAAVTAGTA